METINNYSLPKKAKVDAESNRFSKNFRRFIPSLEELIVRKTLADRRRAMFGKDPFLG